MGQACPGSAFHHLSVCASHLRLPHPHHLRLRKDDTLCSSSLTSPVKPQRSSAACFQTETVRVTKATIIVFMSKEQKSHLGYDLEFRSVGTWCSVNSTEVFPRFVFYLSGRTERRGSALGQVSTRPCLHAGVRPE